MATTATATANKRRGKDLEKLVVKKLNEIDVVKNSATRTGILGGVDVSFNAGGKTYRVECKRRVASSLDKFFQQVCGYLRHEDEIPVCVVKSNTDTYVAVRWNTFISMLNKLT